MPRAPTSHHGTTTPRARTPGTTAAHGPLAGGLDTLPRGRTGRGRVAAGAAGAAAAAEAGALGRLLGGVTIRPARVIARENAAAKPVGHAHEIALAASTGSPLIKFIDRIPGWVWFALAAALLFALLAGAWALWSGHRIRRQAGLFAALSAAALTDPLTGILNRRGFTEAVERELARARRYGYPFVLAYVDVRGLKGVNDTEGHQAGDQLLKEAAALLQESARADDVVGRLGGDEMALLLAEQTAKSATVVTNRVQSEVATRRAALGLRSPWALTVGTATYPEDGETFDQLLRTADQRLYEQRGIALRGAPVS